VIGLVERFQKLQDLIEKRHVTWFIGCTVLVALVTLWGV
jgi:hypothetical protein